MIYLTVLHHPFSFAKIFEVYITSGAELTNFRGHFKKVSLPTSTRYLRQTNNLTSSKIRVKRFSSSATLNEGLHIPVNIISGKIV
ncbi:hypothetical protein CRM22_009548 [Opisthorchis felineus]|uniref:Uncharacterized protein n=1 Tax=Opisthorchis felineus TaxID=147828 RepID=A0A4V3SCZ3_OPIFE|nr:hypothetical protein CRM22_009548 [Opisthorchis felineus]